MYFRGFVFEPSLVPSLATMLVLVLLLALGFWQLDRATEKEGLQRDFEQRAADVPILLNARMASLPGANHDRAWWRHRRVEVAGVLDERRQYLHDNRTRTGVAGYHILSALKVDGSRSGVIVNRGWVPAGSDRRRLPRVTVSPRLRSLRGLVDYPVRTLLLGESGYDAQTWPRVIQRIELERMQRQLGMPLLPFVILLDPDATDGFAREWQPYVGIGPERHYAYAFQWFSLAFALCVLFGVVNTRRVRNG